MDKGREEQGGQGGGGASEGEAEGPGELLGVPVLPGMGMSLDLNGTPSTGDPTNKSSPRGR